jgi:hypothetical protein
MSDTADEQIATSIVEQMRAAGLLTPSQADALRDKIAAGEMKSADWIGLVDYQRKQASHGTQD